MSAEPTAAAVAPPVGPAYPAPLMPPPARTPGTNRLAVWALVAFEVMSLTVAMVEQYPAWSVGRSNLESLTGKTCGLATDVLVEEDPNAGMLAPVSAPLNASLGSTSQGFGPNGIPADLSADPVAEPQGSNNFADSDGSVVSGSEPGTEGGTTAAAGVNGSRARLPYNLDPATTPVMGSWRSGTRSGPTHWATSAARA